MICFRDMTFCSAECGNVNCRRNWNDERQGEADKWWESFKSDDPAPVAFSDLSEGCEGFAPRTGSRAA